MPTRRLAPEFVDTEHNDTAVRYLEAARKSLGATKRDFAERLSAELGVPISENVLGYYFGVKSRRQPVPAAVIFAAARLAHITLDQQPEPKLEARLRQLEERINEVEARLGRRRARPKSKP